MTSRTREVSGELDRLTWPQMLEYWRLHDRRWGDIDYGQDPEGLANICAAGQPLWLGRYYARFQRLVYERLLTLIPPPRQGMRALDVGCGAARWCTLLAARGYRVTGIDIQPTLMRVNRTRFPEIEFIESPLQDFTHAEKFALVSSVTVLQHLPFDEQPRAVARLRSLTASGGHAVVLENIRYQAPDHFSRSVVEWRSMFEDAGFRAVALQPYNFSPALGACSRLRSLFSAAENAHSAADVESIVVKPRDDESGRSRVRALLRLGHLSLLRLAVVVDNRLEPLLIDRDTRLRPTNCGFLFEAI